MERRSTILWDAPLFQVTKQSFLNLDQSFVIKSFLEYTVVSEISCAKISDDAPLDKVCLFGCGVSTGLGAAWKTCDIEANSTVAVFGLGAVGLAIIQAAKTRGARRIFAVDTNPLKFDIARQLGATDVVNPLELPAGTTSQAHIVAQTT
jgi:S-(hydroxymethyl)glutathione dehydrogenase/alcohol dehydrogenase